jgi:hypothetical protein
MVRAYARNLKNGSWTPLKIMVPNIAEAEEMERARELIEETMNKVLDEEGLEGEERDIAIGSMIETPSAALLSDKIAKYADFFSFGTNDLTQFTKGISRDDVAKSFLPFYIENGIFKNDPTQKLDAETVYRLVRTSVLEGRSVKADLSIGICGEHGGEAESVGLFDQAGLSYVSASPLRIPIARLAAAQSAIRMKNNQFTVEEKAIAGGAASLEAHLVKMLSASFTAFGMEVVDTLIAKMAASIAGEAKAGGAMRSEARGDSSGAGWRALVKAASRRGATAAGASVLPAVAQKAKDATVPAGLLEEGTAPKGGAMSADSGQRTAVSSEAGANAERSKPNVEKSRSEARLTSFVRLSYGEKIDDLAGLMKVLDGIVSP